VSTGESRLLGIFTVLNIVALVMIFFLVPETAGATLGSDAEQGLNYISLEELNYIFNVRTRDHVSYQVRVMVPWAWEISKWKVGRWLGRKGEDEMPEKPYELYVWVQAEQVSGLGEEISAEREMREVE
jgi:hypothetical protein